MNRIYINRINDKLFSAAGLFSTMLGLALLLVFLGDVFYEGFNRIDWNFITGLQSRKAEKSGIFSPLMGSIWILVLTTLVSMPIGVAAGIYLEEYVKKGRLSRFLEANITNLAGVPSIIYGLLGLQIFARFLGLGTSILAGSFTLALLVLPIIIVTTRESIKAVPQSIRDASFAMGASKWQTIYFQILPASFGGILTGVILAISRAVGEAAPLIVIGAVAYANVIPKSPMDNYSVLPIRIFDWLSRPQHAFLINAAAAIIILLFITFLLNGIAMYLRNRWQKKVQW